MNCSLFYTRTYPLFSTRGTAFGCCFPWKPTGAPNFISGSPIFTHIHICIGVWLVFNLKQQGHADTSIFGGPQISREAPAFPSVGERKHGAGRDLDGGGRQAHRGPTSGGASAWPVESSEWVEFMGVKLALGQKIPQNGTLINGLKPAVPWCLILTHTQLIWFGKGSCDFISHSPSKGGSNNALNREPQVINTARVSLVR